MQITDRELYGVKSFKFALIVIAFLLGVYAKIFREDITDNFSREKRPKLNALGVNEQLLQPEM